MYEILFWDSIGKFTGDQTREQVFEKVYNLFTRIGIPLTLAQLLKADVYGVYEKTVVGFSYAGPSCHKLKAKSTLEELHEIVTPACMRRLRSDGKPEYSSGFDRACHQLYTRSVECWRWYKDCWKALNDPDLMPEPKASRIETSSMEFLASLKPFGKSGHIYPHVLAAHVPKQVRSFKMDISVYQTQFSEHGHKSLKDAGRRLANGCKAGPAESVAIGAYTRLVCDKEQTVMSHNRDTNTKSETEQLLELSELRSNLRKVVLCVEEQAIAHERTTRAETKRKIASDLKLERDLDKFRSTEY